MKTFVFEYDGYYEGQVFVVVARTKKQAEYMFKRKWCRPGRRPFYKSVNWDEVTVREVDTSKPNIIDTLFHG